MLPANNMQQNNAQGKALQLTIAAEPAATASLINEGFLIIFNYVDKNNYCWLNLGGWNNTQPWIYPIY